MFHSVFLSLQEHVLKEETRRDESRSKTTAGWKRWKGIKMEGGGGGGEGKRQKTSQNLAARRRATRLEFQFLHVACVAWHLIGTAHRHTSVPPTCANAGAYSRLPDIHSHTPERWFSQMLHILTCPGKSWEAWLLWKPSCLYWSACIWI